MKNNYYSNIFKLNYETNCKTTSLEEWNELMKGATRANKRKINALVKKHLPQLFEDLALQFHNPYFYYKTQTHFILAHSAIEYFIRIN